MTEGNTRHLTIIAALLAMIGPFSIDAYLPSFPAIETEFGISRAMLTQSLAVYLLAFGVSTLVWGPLADRYGRRLVILFSMLLYTIGSVWCAVTGNEETFMLARIVQGFAASGGFIAGRAMIRDAHDAESAHRAMSLVMLIFAMAPAVAPVLGGWLHEHYGWRSVFWFLAFFGGFLVVLGFFISETLANQHRRSIHPAAVTRVYLSAIMHRRFTSLILCMSLSFAGLFLYIAGAPSVIYAFLGLGSEDFGWLFIPIVSGLMLGASLSGYLAHRWPAERTVTTGFAVMFLATAFNIIVAKVAPAGLLTVVGPLVLYVTGLSIMMPAVTILGLDCLPTHRGTAASMQGFLQTMTNALVASVAVPMLLAQWVNFILGQALFLSLAAGLWIRFGRNKN